MKKLIISILFILCLSFQASALGPMMLLSGGGGGVAACAKDTGTLVMDESGMSGDATWAVDNTNCVGQQFSYGSNFNLYSIEIHFNNTSSCVIDVRIGTTTDLSSYIEEWQDVAIAADGLYEFVSSSNDLYNASTTYYIGFMEESGTCEVFQDTTSAPYNKRHLAGTVWTLGALQEDRDFHINIYKTTVTPCE